MREDEGVVVPGVGAEKPVRSSAKYGFLGWGIVSSYWGWETEPQIAGAAERFETWLQGLEVTACRSLELSPTLLCTSVPRRLLRVSVRDDVIDVA
jgi:hypothetical protein